MADETPTFDLRASTGAETPSTDETDSAGDSANSSADDSDGQTALTDVADTVDSGDRVQGESEASDSNSTADSTTDSSDDNPNDGDEPVTDGGATTESAVRSTQPRDAIPESSKGDASSEARNPVTPLTDVSNVAEPFIEYARGNIVANEQQALMLFYGWVSGWFEDGSRFINVMVRGESGDGKTHTVDSILDLFDERFYYSSTSGSSLSFVDDPRWNEPQRRFAALDELNKLDDKLKEFVKSVAGDDGGFTYHRGKGGNNESSEVNEHGEAGVDKIEKKAMPYSVLLADASLDSSDKELDTRLMKVFIESSRPINRAVARAKAGHTHVTVGENDIEYIFPTTKVKADLQEHIKTLPMDAHVKMPEWVHWSVEPCLDDRRVASKRVSAMIYNMICASCLSNYHQRPTRTFYEDGEQVEKYVVLPQDVANVMRCQEVLIGTTHAMEPRKLATAMAVKELTSHTDSSVCFLEDVREYLVAEQTQMSVPSKDDLNGILEQLEDQFVVKAHDNYDGTRETAYEFIGLTEIRTPRLTGFKSDGDIEWVQDNSFLGVDDPDDPFKDCVDPITGGSFKHGVEQFRRSLSGDVQPAVTAADAMGSEPQQTLASTETDLSDVVADGEQAWLYDRLWQVADGLVFDKETELAYVLDYVDSDTPIAEASLNGTMLDPSHEMWDQASTGIVATQADAETKLTEAYHDLVREGVVNLEEAGEGQIRIVVEDVSQPRGGV